MRERTTGEKKKRERGNRKGGRRKGRHMVGKMMVKDDNNGTEDIQEGRRGREEKGKEEGKKKMQGGKDYS